MTNTYNPEERPFEPSPETQEPNPSEEVLDVNKLGDVAGVQIGNRFQNANMFAVAEKNISVAFAAGMIAGILGIVGGIVSLAASYQEGLGSFVIAALCFMLAYGISRKSRLCAILLCLIFVEGVLSGLQRGSLSFILSGVFLYWAYKGIVGTFQYHQIAKRNGINIGWAWLMVGICVGLIILLLISGGIILLETYLMPEQVGF
ncbi:MAG: hypothetical protein JW828_03020 [Sedimentisphaerales bacterium]|nr:hypothetical protein [Sedimentisphaerales bacterium]